MTIREIVALVLMAVAIPLLGADTPKYQPTEIQLLRLQVKQRDAQIAQRDLALAQQAVQTAQDKFQQALNNLNTEADRVKSENHWPEKVTFDMNSVSFSDSSKPGPVPEPIRP